MPAIKIYKGRNGEMIPAEEARQGKAYLCPWTGTLVPNKRSYVKHLMYLRKTRMHRAAREKQRRRVLAELWDQPDFDSIISWIKSNPKFMLDNARRNSFDSNKKAFDAVRNDFWIKITYLDLHYSNCVSNSHSAPHNGVTNWGRRDADAPTGYPGWEGRIEWQHSHDLPGFTSNIMKGMRIHTGTGGGSSKMRFGFDVKFFLADWPGLERQLAYDILADNYQNNIYRYHGTLR